MIKAYSGSDTKFEGKKTVLFGGNVVVENITEEPDKKLIQKWRFSSWPENVTSTVTMTFESRKGETRWVLEQTGVPSDDVNRVEQGWRGNYLSRINGVFGWGSPFF